MDTKLTEMADLVVNRLLENKPEVDPTQFLKSFVRKEDYRAKNKWTMRARDEASFPGGQREAGTHDLDAIFSLGADSDPQDEISIYWPEYNPAEAKAYLDFLNWLQAGPYKYLPDIGDSAQEWFESKRLSLFKKFSGRVH